MTASAPSILSCARAIVGYVSSTSAYLSGLPTGPASDSVPAVRRREYGRALSHTCALCTARGPVSTAHSAPGGRTSTDAAG